MPNDAMILGLDSLKFRWRTARTMRAYLVGISADNHGTIQVTEALSSTRIKHRPVAGRPFAWPLGFDGYVFYQKTGGLPDIVKFSLIIVRDKRAARRAGQILETVKNDQEFKEIVKQAKALANGAAGANVALGLLSPVMGVVGRALKDAKDKVLDTIDGGIHLGPDDKQQNELTDTVQSAIATAEFDFHLFDAAEDEDSAAHINGSMDSLRSSGLLIGT